MKIITLTNQYRCVTYSGVLIRVLSPADKPVMILILYSRGFSPLIRDTSSVRPFLFTKYCRTVLFA